VAAVAVDIYGYAFSGTRAGKRRHSYFVSASEGDSDEHTRGLALGAGGSLWSLVDAEHAGDPNEAVIYKGVAGCLEHETLQTPAGPDEESTYRAIDLAQDSGTLYLVVPGTGIVTHDFLLTGSAASARRARPCRSRGARRSLRAPAKRPRAGSARRRSA
jgi:hypothetical protein